MASRRSRRLTVLIIVAALFTALVTRVPTQRDASAFDFVFTDVPAGSYYELAVFWMVQEEITTGTSPTTFSPQKTLERGELAAFLYRFAGAPANYPDHGFSDVTPGDFFHEAVKWLVRFELTTGTTPTTFSPRDPVTRGQAATFLHRLAGEPDADGVVIPFVDVSEGAFYHDAVRWLYSQGITTGTGPTTYEPDRPVLRAELAALLWRFAGEPVPRGVPTTTTAPGSTTSTSTTTTVFMPDLSGRPATTTTAAPPGEYLRIVSIPDFFNVDVGTIAGVFDPSVGMCADLPCGDSRTEVLDTSIWYILESIAADDPDFVLVAGDLVMGHWYADLFDRQVFGPTEDVDDKAAAIDLAGDVYYSQWLDRFDQRALEVYQAVGDHELGDNPWPVSQDRSQLVDEFRAEFAEHFTQNRFDGTVTSANVPARPPAGQWTDTAYAFERQNGAVKVLVISLDVFYQQSASTLIDNDDGTVRATVRDTQLTWLEDLLAGAAADASIDHVIVQGHTPSLVPVRWRSTSQIYMEDMDGSTGEDTALWQLLSQYDVPLYLAGEVHDITHSRSGGVHQVVHGGIIGSLTPVNYLVIDVYEDRLDMHVKQLNVQPTLTRFWQTRQMTTREITIFDPAWGAGFLPKGYLELTRNGNGPYSTTQESGILDCWGTCTN